MKEICPKNRKKISLKNNDYYQNIKAIFAKLFFFKKSKKSLRNNINRVKLSWVIKLKKI
jgi:hypothetical protein